MAKKNTIISVGAVGEITGGYDMRYWAVLFLLLFSFGIFSGCGKPPVDDVNYKELKNTDKPEPQEPEEGAQRMPQ
jgi:hypothetical protein